MAQDGSIFHSQQNHNLPYYPREPLIFKNLRQYHSTPFLLNNPDTESYQEIHSKSPRSDDNNPFEQLQSHTSIKPINFSEPYAHLPPTYQNFPHSLLSHDQFDDFSNSTDSEMLSNSIILYIIPLPFHKHSLVLLTRLNVYLNLPPILKLHPLIFELPIFRIIYAHLFLKATSLRNLLLVSHLE